LDDYGGRDEIYDVFLGMFLDVFGLIARREGISR